MMNKHYQINITAFSMWMGYCTGRSVLPSILKATFKAYFKLYSSPWGSNAGNSPTDITVHSMTIISGYDNGHLGINYDNFEVLRLSNKEARNDAVTHQLPQQLGGSCKCLQIPWSYIWTCWVPFSIILLVGFLWMRCIWTKTNLFS